MLYRSNTMRAIMRTCHSAACDGSHVYVSNETGLLKLSVGMDGNGSIGEVKRCVHIDDGQRRHLAFAGGMLWCMELRGQRSGGPAPRVEVLDTSTLMRVRACALCVASPARTHRLFAPCAQIPHKAPLSAAIGVLQTSWRGAGLGGATMCGDGRHLVVCRPHLKPPSPSRDVAGSRSRSRTVLNVDILEVASTEQGHPHPRLIRRVRPSVLPVVGFGVSAEDGCVALASLTDAPVGYACSGACSDGARCHVLMMFALRWQATNTPCMVVNVVDTSPACTFSSPGTVDSWFIHCMKGGIACFRVWRPHNAAEPSSSDGRSFTLVGENVQVRVRCVCRAALLSHARTC